MKTIYKLVTVILILMSHQVEAQTDALKILPNGNVGIGKEPQTDKLIVGGNLHVEVPVTPTPVDALKVDVAGFGSVDNAKKSTFFKVKDITNIIEPFTIRGDGNIAIGKVPKDDKLLVAGNIHIEVPDTKTPIDALTVDVLALTSPENAKNSTLFKVRDLGNGSQRFTIRGDGNVAIGKVPKDDKLLVAGNIHTEVPASSNPIDAMTVDVENFNNPENAKNSTFFKIRDIANSTQPFTIQGDGSIITKVAASDDPINAFTVNVKSFKTIENAEVSTFFRVKDIDGSQAFMIRGDGNVGIGTENPSQAKLVVVGEIDYPFNGFIRFFDESKTKGNGSMHCSIYASARVAATEFNAFSDQRIKNIIGVSNKDNDLKILSKIEITDYKMIDTIAKGNQLYKKVIAQQVEKVYPVAVSKNLTDVVPDIYQLSTINKGWIEVNAKKDLVAGDKLKLVFSEEQVIVDVLEIGKGKIRVNCEKEGNVFVYGKQVNDFRTVDYEAIAMLNVSATQALLKRIEVLEAKETTSLNRIQELKDNEVQINKRLQKIEERFLHNVAQN